MPNLTICKINTQSEYLSVLTEKYSKQMDQYGRFILASHLKLLVQSSVGELGADTEFTAVKWKCMKGSHLVTRW